MARVEAIVGTVVSALVGAAVSSFLDARPRSIAPDESAPARRPPGPPPHLDAHHMQALLRGLGFDAGASSVWDHQTHAALRRFQQQFNARFRPTPPLRADGVPDAQTELALRYASTRAPGLARWRAA